MDGSSTARSDSLLRGVITDESVEMMRRRIGYPNPTLRSGYITLPWNTEATVDGIRHFAQGYGDLNPLFADLEYASATRWGTVIGSPGLEWTLGFDRSPPVPPELVETRKALRGVHLFNAGHEAWFMRPIVPGDVLHQSTVVARVEDKVSDFGGRSVLVTNESRWTNRTGEAVALRRPWYIHVERREVGEGHKYEKEKVARYSDEDLAAIEDLYDREHRQGSDALWFEDVDVARELPTLVKGPLTVTDIINFFMGFGWSGYGFPPLRIAFENRKRLRGFYSRNQFNAWDAIMRIHWEDSMARKVGVISSYDIGPMRWSWLAHYCTNLAGDDGWVYRVRGEFRRFNYVGDTTWIRATIREKRIDSDLGPLLELELSGTNQRGDQNIVGTATILLPSKQFGPVRIPAPSPRPV